MLYQPNRFARATGAARLLSRVAGGPCVTTASEQAGPAVLAGIGSNA